MVGADNLKSAGERVNLQQQRLHAVGVHHPDAGRPLEHGEAAVLGGDKRHRIALILHELRRREMPRAAELVGMNLRDGCALDGFAQQDLLYSRRSRLPCDLRAEAEQFITMIEDGRAVYRGQAADGANRRSRFAIEAGE